MLRITHNIVQASERCYIVYIHVIQERLAQTMRTCFELKINERIGAAYVHSTTEQFRTLPNILAPSEATSRLQVVLQK